MKGYIVGNGATDWDYDVSPSFPRTVYGFNLVPHDYIEYLEANDCVYYFNDFKPHSGPEGCDAVWNKTQELTTSLNWYDLYQPASANPLSAVPRNASAMVNGVEKHYLRGKKRSEYTPWIKHLLSDENDVVTGMTLSDYLNNATVRTALHIPDSAPGWDMCSSTLDYHVQPEASLWIYEILKVNGIRILFYSGDTDGAVPTYGTKRWIKDLNWPVKTEWTQWHSDGQVAGYLTKYDGLDFLTVKGAGHMAPQEKRKAVQTQIFAFLTNDL